MMCKDPNCSKWIHRHSVEQCMPHKFCAEEPLKGIDGTQKELPEKMAMFGTRELIDWRKIK